MSSEPTEEQLRAYEEELSRLTSVEIAVQAAASLISIGGRRLGLAGGGEGERDLEQVRDAIDGARALMPILERRMSAAQVNQLKGALSQLQMGYAQLAQQTQAQTQTPAAAGSAPPGGHEAAAKGASTAPGAGSGEGSSGTREGASGGGSGDASGGGANGGGKAPSEADEQGQKGPGPAEASGRLWVPGR